MGDSKTPSKAARQGIAGDIHPCPTNRFDPNRFLAFKAAGRGDVPGALERLARGVEVFERYPGLCRSVMG